MKNWLAVAMLGVAPHGSYAQQPLTARDVVERIKQNIGVPWTDSTVDTFKDGNPATPVTGIAVTMMATFDVLRRRGFVKEVPVTFVATADPFWAPR